MSSRPDHQGPYQGRNALTRLADRLLPLLLAVVAGLVLVVGIRGFRAERPGAFFRPFTTRPLITEAERPQAVVPLAAGRMLILQPGTVAYSLTRFLEGNGTPPARFPLMGVTLPLSGSDSDSDRTLRALAAILAAWPDVRIHFEGDTDATPIVERLVALGVARDRLQADADNPASDSSLLDSLGLGDDSDDADNSAIQLVITAR